MHKSSTNITQAQSDLEQFEKVAIYAEANL